jgi:hypothetical protein
VGQLDRPERLLPFEHARHLDNAQCRSCHKTGLQLSAAKADCNGCHASHQSATADCTACHAVPAKGAHTRLAHLSCAGTGCHVNAAETVLEVPRTRQACLACHRDLAGHKAASECADCHKLPKPQTRTR